MDNLFIYSKVRGLCVFYILYTVYCILYMYILYTLRVLNLFTNVRFFFKLWVCFHLRTETQKKETLIKKFYSSIKLIGCLG